MSQGTIWLWMAAGPPGNPACHMRLIPLLLLLVTSGPISAQPSQTNKSLTLLRKVLAEQPAWIKVHAAEYLIWAGYPDGVREVFIKEHEQFGDQSPYRIGIWRVLAQSATSETERTIWTDKIKKAFLDPEAQDRLHASESLAKLRISPFPDDPDLTEETLASPVKPLAIYTLWSVAYTSDQQFGRSQAKLISLVSDSPQKESAAKSMAAYAIRHLGNVRAADWERLARAALKEPAGSPARVYLLAAAWVTCPENETDPGLLTLLHNHLLGYQNANTKAERSEMAMALAAGGNAQDLPVLRSLLNNENSLGNEADDYDVMAAAAYAILRIEERQLGLKGSKPAH
jgi:hypothetical protein